MTACIYTEECVFFKEEVGFSPELNQEMRETYCLGGKQGCARLRARDHLPLDEIPVDLIPTENDRLDMILPARQ